MREHLNHTVKKKQEPSGIGRQMSSAVVSVKERTKANKVVEMRV